MIESYQFARMLTAELRQPVKATVWPDYTLSPPYYRVTGRLDVGVVLASVEIRVWQDFSVLKQLPPAVWCDELWMREDADWHNSSQAGMCWILQQVWCDAMNWPGKPVRAVLEEGRAWLLNGVRCLVNRHYTAHLEGLVEWPKEWPFWGHYSEGPRQYEQEKKELKR